MATKKRELLLYGFTRLNYTTNFGNVPDDIILLFNKWISNALYMIIKGDKLKQFMSTKHNNCMKETVTLKVSDETSFVCTLYPNEKVIGMRHVGVLNSLHQIQLFLILAFIEWMWKYKIQFLRNQQHRLEGKINVNFLK